MSERIYVNSDTIGMKLLIRVSHTRMRHKLSDRPPLLARRNNSKYLEVFTVLQGLVVYLLLATEFSFIFFHCKMLLL
jgi:hypothetical protein